MLEGMYGPNDERRAATERAVAEGGAERAIADTTVEGVEGESTSTGVTERLEIVRSSSSRSTTAEFGDVDFFAAAAVVVAAAVVAVVVVVAVAVVAVVVASLGKTATSSSSISSGEVLDERSAVTNEGVDMAVATREDVGEQD